MLEQAWRRTKRFSLWNMVGVMAVGLLAACGSSNDDDPPAAPTELTASAAGTEVTLNWKAPSDADSFNLYWSNAAGVTTTTGIKLAGVTAPYVHTGCPTGTTCYYVVTGVNEEGEGKASAEASATLVPAAPTGVSALSGDKQVTVDWDDNVVGAASYNLYWSTSATVPPSAANKIENVKAPFVHAPLQNGTPYFYAVTAVGAAGESPASQIAGATPQVPLPTAPQNALAVVTPETTKSVTLTWSPPLVPDPSEILSYNVYRSTTPGIVPGVTVATKFENKVSPYVDIVPAGQVTYYYVVTAVDAAGEGPASNETAATPKGSPSGGGGDTGFGNNLSVPLVFANGLGIGGAVITGTDYTDTATGLRPTVEQTVVEFPYLDPADIAVLDGVSYYQQQTSSTWQASWLNGKDADQKVELDWGDNLVSASLSANQTIRVETVLRQYKGVESWSSDVAMSGYPMTFLFGEGIDEMQGTTGVAADATERRVYTVHARLKIEKIDAEGNVIPSQCGFEGSIAEGLALPDGTRLPKYAAEINVGGSQTYGFNWAISRCPDTQKAGQYRITFSLDDAASVGGTNYSNNVSIYGLHPSETTAVLDESGKFSTIVVTVQ